MNYLDFYYESIFSPERFWKKQAEGIRWHKAPEKILSQDSNNFYRWFEDGELNTSYLALDYHIENGRGEEIALIYDSPVTNTIQKFTFSALREEVAQLAGALQDLGIKKGDTVVIYMPMIPQAVMAMLACARLGAIHSVVFGGFAPHELAIRLEDAQPKVLMTASCGIEFSKVIPYKPLVDEAIQLSHHKPETCIVFQRKMHTADLNSDIDLDWEDAVKKTKPVEPVPVKATDPLYILYTSGTTGKPKGIVRDNGGHAVALTFSMRYLYNVRPGDVFWAASDVGWVVGHSYIVYAPLIYGCTTIVFEGKPVRTPDAGTFWRVIQEHKVNVFFTAPTAFRAIRKEDSEAQLLKKYDISSLQAIFVAGERCDPATLEWLQIQTNLPIIDHWWQTESGWAMVGNPLGFEQLPVKSGSATLPMCGYNVVILCENGIPLTPNEEGYVCVELPMPPGCLPTLWKDDERFRSSYLSKFKGYYLTGDGGYMDEDGYVFIMGRIDDVINVAGHRLSTGEMEEIISGHPSIAECAVVGISDELRGQRPIGLLVLKDGQEISEEQIQEELVQLIRDRIGAVAFFKNTLIVKRLPKTRSGKILRKTMRQIADGKEFTIPSTIDDPEILNEIKECLKNRKIGKAFL